MALVQVNSGPHCEEDSTVQQGRAETDVGAEAQPLGSCIDTYF